MPWLNDLKILRAEPRNLSLEEPSEWCWGTPILKSRWYSVPPKNATLVMRHYVDPEGNSERWTGGRLRSSDQDHRASQCLVLSFLVQRLPITWFDGVSSPRVLWSMGLSARETGRYGDQPQGPAHYSIGLPVRQLRSPLPVPDCELEAGSGDLKQELRVWAWG